MGEKLKTHDKLKNWEINPTFPNVCVLCFGEMDSHEHLFFRCPFAAQVWSLAKNYIQIPVAGNSWKHVVDGMCSSADRRNARVIIAKLVFGASVYYLWQERNARLFKRKSSTYEAVVELVYSTVRLKIMSIKWKDNEQVRNMKAIWKIP
ncbi:uncharacterized protein [Rutidosis leptorrhynchoides]|uniref:uncharacterized protein n=1 Tax=Rutidosis leptorrhynchoides TaxID=125765 RepID=UPI003A9A5F8A